MLERAHGLSRPEIAGAVDGLLSVPGIVVEAADRAGLATDLYRYGGAGFSDHMIALAAQDAGCRAVFSFDRRVVGQGGMRGARCVPT